RTGSLIPSLTVHLLYNLGATSDLVFGRLRAAGMHWTSTQHFLYLGGGSLGLAMVCGLIALVAHRHDRAKGGL
ncbi:MAG TPA: hypothetical protein VN203_10455, partial [Candidatus Acidoferrum sp.]|nr:hypothetical protein [Candidatus Acidoferrum sp.]